MKILVLNFGIQKSLVRIFERRFPHKHYYIMFHHILSPYMEFGIKINMKILIFYHSNEPTHPYF
jgi:hypothetical protein